MAQRPALTALFPRSSRAIHADSLAPGLAILVTLMVLLLGWMLWLLFFKVPFYQTSQAAQVTPEALIVADFPRDLLSQIEFGQAALFVPGAATDTPAGSGNALTATVVEVDPEQGQVWLMLTEERTAASRLTAGQPGQVHVVVREASPLVLILEAAGMGSSV